jgi:hypothetical protein
VIPKKEVDAAFGVWMTSSSVRGPILGKPNGLKSNRLGRDFDANVWDAVLTAVSLLKRDGFSCIESKSGFVDHTLLWAIGTFSYANGLFGSRQIVEWVGTEPFFQGSFRGDRLMAGDIRCFRRNNRKLLTLSLEAIFRQRRLVPNGLPFSCKSSAYDFAERCVLEAIRWDAGDFDE